MFFLLKLNAKGFFADCCAAHDGILQGKKYLFSAKCCHYLVLPSPLPHAPDSPSAHTVAHTEAHAQPSAPISEVPHSPAHSVAHRAHWCYFSKVTAIDRS